MRALAAVLATALLAGCTAAVTPAPSSAAPLVEGGPASPAAPAPAGPRTLVTGLEVPWALAFLPAGSALVTERRSARLLRVTPAGAVTPVGTVAGVQARGEGGLMGIAVSPAFPTDRAIFVMYTSASDNRVVRLRVAPDGSVDGAAQQVVVSGIPAGAIHNGGGLAFGPDGLLYVATGESGRRGPAQDLADPGGKILRVTPAGAPAPGNPFGSPTTNSAVYSYGHRNVQGLAFTPDGRLFASEFGQNTFDEINLITAGANYGWPTVEGIGRRPGLTDPLVTWSTAEASPSGMAYAGGALWVSALRGQRLWRVPVTPTGLGPPAPLLVEQFGRIRGVTATPDGTALWITTSNRDGRGTPGPGDDKILVLPAR